LGQADGLEGMKLRAFQLTGDPTRMPPPVEVKLPGWSWFPPHADPEKIALVTDAAVLGLFGIRQAGTTDPALFPLVGSQRELGEEKRTPARAQLVAAGEDGYWVLAGEELQRFRVGLDRVQGRRLVPLWDRRPRLGAPLHAAQADDGRETLYLVTQTTT